MKTYSDGYSYEEALIDEMDELGFDRTSPIEWSRKTRGVSHKQKLKEAPEPTLEINICLPRIVNLCILVAIVLVR